MFEILFEDTDIVVINKPPGVVVNAADTTSDRTVQAWMAGQLPQSDTKDWQALVPDTFVAEYGTPEEVFAERQGLVHRLDKETSGALVLAKNPGALVNLLG